MKRFVKLLISFMVIFGIFSMVLPKISNAAKTIDSIAGEFNPENNDNVSYNSLKEIIAKLLGFLQVATGLISVIVIATTGYSYIVTTPPDLKGEMKRKMLPVILGLILVFSAVSIAKFIVGSIE